MLSYQNLFISLLLFFCLIFLLGLRQFVLLSLHWLGIELGLWHQLLIVFSLYFTLSYYVKKFGLERVRNYVVCVVLIELMVITTPWTLKAWSETYTPLLKIYL